MTPVPSGPPICKAPPGVVRELRKLIELAAVRFVVLTSGAATAIAPVKVDPKTFLKYWTDPFPTA